MFLVGSDVGGTFTDTIILDEQSGQLMIGKVLTTPEDPSEGVLLGLKILTQEQKISPAEIKHLIHGTTLVTNAMIERRGAKTALITTKGFRDTLEARREKRPDLFDIFVVSPEPLVPRHLRREVLERMDEAGTIVIPLDRADAESVVKELMAEGVEAIAVCLLHSFRNPAHERMMQSVIAQIAPELYASLSVDVVPKIREFERTSTTVANAYTQPLMEKYLSILQDELHKMGCAGSLYVMLSNDGITTGETAQKFPVRVIESGPAAGAIAAAFYCETLGLDRALSFDMGGTTAKTCLIEEGKPTTTTGFEVAKVYRFKKGSGLPIGLPVIDMIEIGVGGGSIASIDRMGLLKVGPRSAGANPGPACYNRGGADATVTDANLVLGYLNPGYFLGGEMRLEETHAREAIDRNIGKPSGMKLVDAAWGIHQVVDENMVNAARVYIMEKGKDPRSYPLIAFGGAGPSHAYWVAEKLGMEKIIIPRDAGVTSALGFLTAPFAFDFVRTYMTSLRELDFDFLNTLFNEMESEGTRLLKRAGIMPKDITILRTCEMRYIGQGHEILVPILNGQLHTSHLSTIQASFDEQYRKRFHRVYHGYDLEAINWRVVVMGPKPSLPLQKVVAKKPEEISQAVKGKRPVFFPEFKGYVDCKVYDRSNLFYGASFHGPAIVEERESTTVIGPDAEVVVDEFLNLHLILTRRS